jgi:uncharacterized membrane protein YdjX (TVP38/TMEM64 family)
MQAPKLNPTFIVFIVAVLIGGYLLIANMGARELYLDMDALILRLRELEIAGPLLVIGLMALAIVFNPLPSAPIALASGAVYGHTLGTVYIVAGAEIGAVIAFMIARLTGFQLFQKYISDRWSLDRFTTQNSLMVIIFASRLIPFLSFDLISYAAGLTPITLWRFSLATFLGLIPTSFLLAHFGGEMAEANFHSITILMLLIGLVTLSPILIKAIIQDKHKESGNHS